MFLVIMSNKLILLHPISLHPYPPFNLAATRLLIGSMPPYRFCQEEIPLKEGDVDFFYGSRDNAFWRLLAEVFGVTLSYEKTQKAIQERRELLLKNNLGITDIVDSCIHQGGKSSDEDLKQIQYRNIPVLLEANPQIDTLIYTSNFIKSHLYKAFKISHSKTEHHKIFQAKINQKIYVVKILYSPSPTALRGLGKDGRQRRLIQYKKILTI